MAGRVWKPDIGTNVWFVTEHLYYVPGRNAPEHEYCVYQGEIIRYRVGAWTDAVIKYRCEEGYTKLTDVALKANDPRIFDNPRDAALLAREYTEEYMRRWRWIWNMWRDTPPMRRSWEKYIT